jgi:hypothetical protein
MDINVDSIVDFYLNIVGKSINFVDCSDIFISIKKNPSAAY